MGSHLSSHWLRRGGRGALSRALGWRHICNSWTVRLPCNLIWMLSRVPESCQACWDIMLNVLGVVFPTHSQIFSLSLSHSLSACQCVSLLVFLSTDLCPSLAKQSTRSDKRGKYWHFSPVSQLLPLLSSCPPPLVPFVVLFSSPISLRIVFLWSRSLIYHRHATPSTEWATLRSLLLYLCLSLVSLSLTILGTFH